MYAIGQHAEAHAGRIESQTKLTLPRRRSIQDRTRIPWIRMHSPSHQVSLTARVAPSKVQPFVGRTASKEQQLPRKTGVDEVVSKDSATETECRH